MGWTSTPCSRDAPLNPVKINFMCTYQVWPESAWDPLRITVFLSFSKLSYLLLLVPKYCPRVLTTFSPTYSFWMKLKLILSGLVRSCVRFPHPTIKALQCGRRERQATTPPSWCRRGSYFLSPVWQLWIPESQNLPNANLHILRLTQDIRPSF